MEEVRGKPAIKGLQFWVVIRCCGVVLPQIVEKHIRWSGYASGKLPR